MRGEVAAVWTETWEDIWVAAYSHEGAKRDLYCELYRAAVEAKVFRTLRTREDLADAIDDPDQAREAFRALSGEDFAGERGAVAFLETAFDVMAEQGGDALSNHYFTLLEVFIAKFSLRYELRRPCQLCPTLPGIFTGMVRELRAVAATDAHLQSLLQDFERALHDLKADQSDGRIKTCIQKQINFLEALARTSPGVTAGELGAMCHQLSSWPHNAIRASLGNLYGFASDYPGIRHGGNPDGALRGIDLRDVLAVSVVLAGFAPYLAHGLNSDDAYGGRAG